MRGGLTRLIFTGQKHGRDVATGKEARDIYKIGTVYADADETLAKLGYAPKRQPGQIGFTHHR